MIHRYLCYIHACFIDINARSIKIKGHFNKIIDIWCNRRWSITQFHAYLRQFSSYTISPTLEVWTLSCIPPNLGILVNLSTFHDFRHFHEYAYFWKSYIDLKLEFVKNTHFSNFTYNHRKTLIFDDFWNIPLWLVFDNQSLWLVFEY